MFLGDRDFFGECCGAAKKRGLHVIARMSPDLNWEDAVEAHPEWFQRDGPSYPGSLLVAAGEQEENGPQAVRFGGPPKKSAGVRTVSQKMTFFGQ